MNRKIVLLSAALVCLILSGTNVSGQQKAASQLKFTGSLLTGYNRGFGILGNVTAMNFDTDFPLRFRFGIGLNFLNPGNAIEARKIFVNNATNGTPEKSGHSFDYKLDFMIPKTVFGVEYSYFTFGPRFSTFVGDFKYVGGNEDFEVRSHQWGVGGSFENHFKMMKNLELVLNYGVDLYLPATMSGHDSSYSPDNDNINPKDNNQNNDLPFKYRDANRAIYQPFIMPHILIGVCFDI